MNDVVGRLARKYMIKIMGYLYDLLHNAPRSNLVLPYSCTPMNSKNATDVTIGLNSFAYNPPDPVATCARGANLQIDLIAADDLRRQIN